MSAKQKKKKVTLFQWHPDVLLMEGFYSHISVAYSYLRDNLSTYCQILKRWEETGECGRNSCKYRKNMVKPDIDSNLSSGVNQGLWSCEADQGYEHTTICAVVNTLTTEPHHHDMLVLIQILQTPN